MESVVLTGEEARGEAVIEACKQGDRDAFRRLFERHKDRVYSIALYFFGGDEATAADVTQQVFLKLFTRIRQFQGESEFTTWLYRLTTNVCVDEHRKRRRVQQFGEFVEVPEPGAGRTQEDRLARAEVARSVKRAVAALKPKLRVVMLLKYFEELSYEEIAGVLGLSKGTVASRLNRGHKALARKLDHLRVELVRDEREG
ncbi:MAG: polymerase sigma-70 factor, subfamily [Acidobacteriota bacterium]|jgi:RNA polymerase sigma-70 factor (ECF subfamily)|nr:polymerase sigma-70 factor, subfamily [Acidobacteriota bacterium]